MEMRGFEDQGTGPIHDNNGYAAPNSYVAAEDLELLDMLPMDVAPLLGEDTPLNNHFPREQDPLLLCEPLLGQQQQSGFESHKPVSSFGEYTPLNETTNNYFLHQQDPFLLYERQLGQRQQSNFESRQESGNLKRKLLGLEQQSSFQCQPGCQNVNLEALLERQQTSFKSQPESGNVNLKLLEQHGLQQQSSFESQLDAENELFKAKLASSASLTIEEHPAALPLSHVLGSGMPCNRNEALKAEKVYPIYFCGYKMEDVIKKLGNNSSLRLRSSGNYESSSPLAIRPSVSKKDSTHKRQQRQHPVSSYSVSRGLSVNPESVAARNRGKEFREKIRCLEQIIPLGTKLETFELLQEASKYVKFLQAQVQVLEHMPSSPFPLHSKDRGELLQALVTSPTIQGKLFREQKCVGTVEQYQMLATTTGSSK